MSRKLWPLLLLLCLATVWPAWAQYPVSVNPRTYLSPTGLYTCLVDPSDIYARGAGHYVFKKDGRPVWSGDLPFTLFEAQITDDGTIGGYAYTQGYQGMGSKKGHGELLIVILLADGTVVLKESLPREFSRIIHGAPQPFASLAVASLGRDVLQVRLHYDDRQEWRTYRLSSGKRVEKDDPFTDEPRFLQPLSLKPVRGTPLILAHYWQYQKGEVGARFRLLDGSKPPVWNLDFPKDYVFPDKEDLEESVRRKVRQDGAILDVSQSNRFALYTAATKEKLTFEVRPDPKELGQWLVKEIAREPYPAFLGVPAVPPVFEEKPLKLLGMITMQAQEAALVSPVRDLQSFAMDASGRFGFIRADTGSKAYSFVLVDHTGKLLHELALPLTPDLVKNSSPLTAWLAGDRWLITASDAGIGGKSAAWWFDASDAKLSPVPDFTAPPIWEVAGSPDGGFVAKCVTHQKYTMLDEIIAFDASGKIRWRLEERSNDKPGSFFGPEDVTVTKQGTIALVDNIRDTVQFYDAKGKYLRTWKLDTLLGRKASYPSMLKAGFDGSLLIHDFQGNPPLLRFDETGKLLAATSMKYADGRVIEHLRGAAVTADGHVWISDGECLARLDITGVVDRILGPPPSTEALGRAGAAVVDQAGQTYLADDRTGAVQVFDRTGQYLRTCRPLPTDFSGRPWLPTLSVGPAGDVYFQPESGKPVIHFAPDGSRKGQIKLSVDFTQKFYPLPQQGQSLVLGYQKAVILDAARLPLVTITRRPDRNWLETLDVAAIAADGSFAINTGWNYGEHSWPLHLYDSKGAPSQTIIMPKETYSSGFAYTGRHVAALSLTHIYLLDLKGEPVLKSPLPETAKKPEDRTLCTSMKGKELWLLNKAGKTVHRYVLP